MEIRKIQAAFENETWDQYVQSRTTSVLDLSAWSKVLGDSYSIAPHFLAAFEEEQMSGGLALYEIKHPLSGQFLVTAPFGSDGGFFFDNEEIKDLLVQQGRKLADEVDADYLLIRTRGAAITDFDQHQRYCAPVVPIEADAEATWKNLLRAKTRNQIRKGMKSGFELFQGAEYLPQFYEVFHRHMRDLGSPAHSLEFYRSIQQHLGDYTDFLVVRKEGKLVGGSMMFHINDVAMNLQTVTLDAYKRLCANYLLYWRMIEIATQYGCRKFDMGRSLVDGQVLRFKKKELEPPDRSPALQLLPEKATSHPVPGPRQSEIQSGHQYLETSSTRPDQASMPQGCSGVALSLGKIPRYKKQDTNKFQITSSKLQTTCYPRPGIADPREPRTGELPVLRSQVRQSRERLDLSAT